MLPSGLCRALRPMAVKGGKIWALRGAEQLHPVLHLVQRNYIQSCGEQGNYISRDAERPVQSAASNGSAAFWALNALPGPLCGSERKGNNNLASGGPRA